MEKTKLGISVTLAGAALYFFGIGGMLTALVPAGYVLLFEENESLKRTAVKALAVVLFFAVMLTAVDLVDDVFRALNNFIALLFQTSINMSGLNQILTILTTLLGALRSLCLLLLGFNALKGAEFKIGPVDDLISKHL